MSNPIEMIGTMYQAELCGLYVTACCTATGADLAVYCSMPDQPRAIALVLEDGECSWAEDGYGVAMDELPAPYLARQDAMRRLLVATAAHVRALGAAGLL